MKYIVFGCLTAAILIFVAGVAIIWFWLFLELPILDAALSIPSEVELGSTVTMVITATNDHEKSITLDSVDIDDSFLSGFQVVSIKPKPTETYHVSIMSQRSWGFDKPVAPGQSLSVAFQLKSVMEGHFSGDVDVCNPNQDFKTLLADVVVRKKLSNQAVDDDKK